MITSLKYLATHKGMKGGIQPNKPLFFNLKMIIFNIESYGKIKYLHFQTTQNARIFKIPASKSLTFNYNSLKKGNLGGFQAKYNSLLYTIILPIVPTRVSFQRCSVLSTTLNVKIWILKFMHQLGFGPLAPKARIILVHYHCWLTSQNFRFH